MVGGAHGSHYLLSAPAALGTGQSPQLAHGASAGLMGRLLLSVAEQILPIDRVPYCAFSLTTSWRAFRGAALNMDTGEFARTPSAGAAVRLLQVPWGTAAPTKRLESGKRQGKACSWTNSLHPWDP